MAWVPSPSPRRERISRSRSVSWSITPPGVGTPARRFSTCWATSGPKTTSARATAVNARLMSPWPDALSRYPRAPARTTASTRSFDPNMVSTRIAASGRAVMTARVASTRSRSGICRFCDLDQRPRRSRQLQGQLGEDQATAVRRRVDLEASAQFLGAFPASTAARRHRAGPAGPARRRTRCRRR